MNIELTRVSISPTKIVYQSNYFKINNHNILYIIYYNDNFSFDIFKLGKNSPILTGRGINANNTKKLILKKIKEFGVSPDTEQYSVNHNFNIK